MALMSRSVWVHSVLVLADGGVGAEVRAVTGADGVVRLAVVGGGMLEEVRMVFRRDRRVRRAVFSGLVIVRGLGWAMSVVVAC